MRRGSGRFPPEKRVEVVLMMLGGKVSVAELCRENQVSTTMLYRWRDAFLEAGKRGLLGDAPSDREQRLERELAHVKEVVGDLAVANHLLKGGRTFSTSSEGGRV